MQVGDIVYNKQYKIYGTVAFSTFGVSIHFYADGVFSKTLGYPPSKLSKHWEVCDMPEGYRIGEWGGLIKDEL